MYSGKAQTSDSSFLFNIISLGWSIEFIEGSQAMISKPLKIAFVSANGVDPDDAAFHLDLQCLSKYSF